MRQINLLPDNLKKEHRLRTLRKALFKFLLPVIGFLVIFHMFFVLKISVFNRIIAKDELKREQADTKLYKVQIKKMQDQMMQVVKQSGDVIDVASKQFLVSNSLAVISQSAYQKVWLNSLYIDLDNQLCRIEGKSFNTRLVSEFMLELRKAAYFEAVELKEMGKEDKKQETEIDFELICQFQ